MQLRFSPWSANMLLTNPYAVLLYKDFLPIPILIDMAMVMREKKNADNFAAILTIPEQTYQLLLISEMI